jgi:hypothetical protein
MPHSLSCRHCGKPLVFDAYEFDRSPEEIAYLTGFPPCPLSAKKIPSMSDASA